MSDRHSAAPERLAFSYSLVVDDVPEGGLAIVVTAAPGDCEAIARQLDLPAVASLAVRYRVSRRPAGRLQVEGDLSARVTQVCVVSLEPFESEVTNMIDATFAPAPRESSAAGRETRRRPGREAARRGPIDVREMALPAIGDDPDMPDPIVDGRIDLGALALEFLALGLDFYPKRPGVAFTELSVGETDERQPSVFAALERLKDRS